MATKRYPPSNENQKQSIVLPFQHSQTSKHHQYIYNTVKTAYKQEIHIKFEKKIHIKQQAPT